MSWVQDEWKDGLNQKVLLKISELENQNEKWKKETKQKQFQLESLEAAFSKQKKRAEDEKSEITVLKRECQSLTEVCSKLECKVDKLSHELRSKESYASNIEGQLQRCKAQLDQYTSKTPKHHRKEVGGIELSELKARMEEIEGLLQNEKQRNRTLEKEVQDLKTKPPSASAASYKSSLPWATDDCTSPLRSNKPSVLDLLTGSPVVEGGDGLLNMVSGCLQTNSLNNQADLLKELETLKQRNEELQTKLTNQEKETKKKCDKLVNTQIECEEANAKVTDYEKKLKHVTEELNCERRNGESVRNNLQEKLKEQEKIQLREVTRAENCARDLENQLRTVKQELNQGLSQCRVELNQVRNELVRTGSNRDKLDADLKKAKQQITQLEQMKQINEKKISELDSSLKATIKEKDSLLQRYDLSESKRNDLEKRNEALQKEFKSCQRQLSSVEQQLAHKHTELEEQKKKAEAAAKNNNACIENLKSKLCDFERKKCEAENVIKKKQKDSTELNAKLIESERKLAEVEEDFRKLQNNFNLTTREMQALDSKLKSFTEKAKISEKELEKVKDAHKAEMERMSNKLREECENFKKKLTEVERLSQAEMTSLMTKHTKEIESLNSKVEEDRKQAAGLDKDWKLKEEELLGRLQATESEASKLQSAKEKLIEEIDAARREVEEIRNATQSLQKKLDETSTQLDALQKEHCSLEHHHSLVVQESQENGVERQALEGRVQDLEKQVEELKMVEMSSAERAKVCEREEALLKKVAALEENAVKVSQELDVLNAEKSMLSENLEKFAKEKENVAKELLQVTSSIESRITEYEITVQSKDKALESLQENNKKIQSEKNALLKEISEVKTSLHELECENAKQQQIISEITEVLKEKDAQVVALTADCEGLVQRSEMLQSEIVEKETKMQQLAAEKAENHLKLEQVTEMFNRSQQEANELAQSLAGDNEEKSCLQDRLLDSQALLDNLQDEMKHLMTCHQEALIATQKSSFDFQSEVESLKLSLEEVTNEKRSAEDLADDRLAIIRDNKQQIESLIIERDNANIALQDARLELSSLRSTEADLNEQITGLRQTLEAKNAKVEELNAESANIKTSLNTLESKYDDICKQLEGKCDELAEVEGELQMLQQNVDLKTSEISRMGEDQQQAQSVLTDEIKRTETEKELLESELEKTAEKLKAANNLIEKQRLENQYLAKNMYEAHTESQKVAGNLELLQMDVEDKDRELQVLQTVTIPQLEDEVEDHRKGIRRLEEKEKAVEGNLEDLHQTIDGLSNEKISLQQQITSLQSQLEGVETERESLKSHVEALQSNNDNLSAEAEEFEETLSSEVQRYSELEASLVECTAKLTQQLHEISQLKHEVDDLKAENQELSKELVEVSEEKGKLDEILKEKNEMAEGKSSQTESLDTKVEELEQKLKRIEEECDAKVAKAEEECEELHSGIKELRKVAGEAQWKSDNLQSLYDRISQDNAQLRQENESLVSDVNTASHTLMDLEDQLDEAERKVEERSSGEEIIAKLKAEVEELKQEKRGLEAEVAQVSEDLNAKMCECDGLLEECREGKVRLANLQHTADTHRAEVVEASRCEEDLNENLQELSRKVASLQAEVAEKQEEIVNLKNQLHDLNTSYQQLEDERSEKWKKVLIKVDELSDQVDYRIAEYKKLEENFSFSQAQEVLAQQRNEQLEAEMQDLEKQLSETIVLLEKSDLERQDLSQRITDSENALKDHSLSADNQVQALKNKCGKIEAEMKVLHQDKSELERILQETLEEMSTLRIEGEKAAESWKKLSNEKSGLENTLQNLLNEKDVVLKGSALVAAQVETLETELEAKELLRCDQATEIVKLGESLLLVEKNNVELTQESEKLRGEVLVKEAVCTKLREVLVNLEKKLEEVQISLRHIVAERDRLKQVIGEKENEMAESQRGQGLWQTKNVELMEALKASEFKYEAENQFLRQEVDNFREKLLEKTNQHQIVESLLRCNDSDMNSLKESLAAREVSARSWQQQVEELQKKLRESMCAIERLTAEQQSSFALLQSRNELLESLKLEINQSREEQAAAVEASRSKQDIEMLNGTLEQLNSDLSEKSRLILSLQLEKDAESALLASVTSELNEDRKMLIQEKQQHADDVTRLKADCDAISRELDALKNVVDDLKKKDEANLAGMNEKQKMLEEIVAENREISLQLENSVHDNGMLYEQINDLTCQLTDYRCNSNIEIEKLQTLSHDRESVAMINTELNSELEELKKENNQLLSQVCELAGKCKSSEAEQLSLRSALNTMQVSMEELKEKLAVTALKSASEVSTLESKLNSLNTDMTSLEVQHKEALDCVIGEVDELKNERSGLMQDVKDLKRQRKMKNGEIIDLQDQLSAATIKLSELTPKFKHLTATTEELKTALHSKSSELSHVLDTVSVKDTQLDTIRKELASAQLEHASALEERNTKIVNMNEEFVKLEMELEGAIQTLQKAEKSANDQDEKIHGLEAELLQKKEEIVKIQEEFKEASEERNMLIEKQKESENVEKNLREKMEKLKLELESNRGELRRKVNELKTRYFAQHEESESLKVREEDLKEEILRLHITINELRTRANDDRTNLKRYRDLIDQLQESQRSQLDSIAVSGKGLAQLRHEHEVALEEKQKVVTELEADNTSLKAEVFRMKEELSDANLELNRIKLEATSYCDEITRLNDEVRRLNVEAFRLNEEASRARAKASRLSCESVAAERSLREREVLSLKAEKRELKLEAERCGMEVRESKRKLEEMMKCRENDRKISTEQLQQSSETMGQLEAKIALLDEQLQSEQTRLSDACNSLSAKDGELAALANQLESARLQHASEQERMNKEIAELKKELLENKDVIENLESGKTKHCDEITRSRDAIEALNNDLNQLKEEKSRFCDETNQLGDEIKRLNDENCLSGDKISQLSDEIKTLNEELTIAKQSELPLKDEIRQSTETAGRLQKELSEAKKELSALSDEQARWKDEASASAEQISKLKDELSTINQQLTKARKDAEELRNKTICFNDDMDRVNDELLRTKSECKKLLAGFEDKEAALVEVRNERESLAEEKGVMEEQMRAKEKMVDEQRAKISMMENMLSETSLSNSQMMDRLKQLDQTISADSSRYKERIARLSTDNDALLDSFSTLKRSAKALQEEKDALLVERDEWEMRMKKLREEEERLSDENHRFKLNVEELEREEGMLKKEVATLRGTVEELEEGFEQMSLQNGELEDRLRDAESLMEETSLAMEDLRLKLDEERKLAANQQQSFAVNETKSRADAATLHCDAQSLRDRIAVMEEEHRETVEFEREEHKVKMEVLTDAHRKDVEAMQEVLAGREKELTEYSRDCQKKFQALKEEVCELEERNFALESELMRLQSALDEAETGMESLRQDRDERADQARNGVAELIGKFEKLQRDMDSSEAEKDRLREQVVALEEEMEGLRGEKESLVNFKCENAKLQKEVETLNSKLTLMTCTARRKEKELHRALNMLSGRREQESEQASNSNDAHPSMSSQSVTIKRSRPKRLSRKSAKLEKMVVTQVPEGESSPKQSHTPPENSPKVSRPSQESSPASSPNFQVEGLPHLVNKEICYSSNFLSLSVVCGVCRSIADKKVCGGGGNKTLLMQHSFRGNNLPLLCPLFEPLGFTNIPQGFSSPFVLRRQQINKTKQLVASAISRKRADEPKETVPKEEVDPMPFSEKPPVPPRIRHKSESDSKHPSPPDVATEPLQTVTNSPNRPTFSPPQPAIEKTKQLRLGLSKSPSAPNTDEEEVDCKVQ